MRQSNMLNKISLVISYALPMTATGMINMLANFIAMKMVAQISRAELAAGALSVATFITIMTVAMTIFFAVGILISHQRGKEQSFADTGQIVRNGIWMSFMLAIPAALALWHVDKILLLFGETPELVDIARGYFHFAAPLMLPILLIAVFSQFYAGTGRPNFSTLVATITLPLSVAGSYIFVLGNVGMPQLGLAGITCANLIAQTIVVIAILLFLYASGDMKKYAIFSGKRLPDVATCRSILTLGFPIGIQFGGEIAAMTCATLLLGHFGIAPLSASQIVGQYVLFAVMVTLGISQALALLTSEAFGRKDLASIKDYLNASYIILTACYFFIWFVFLEMPDTLVHLFVSQSLINDEILALSRAFFKVGCVLLFFDGLRNMLTGTLRGIHDSKAPMRIGIASMWLISLPISYVVGFTLNYGPIGQRAGFTTGFIIATAWLMIRLKQKYNVLDKTLVQEDEQPEKVPA